METLFDQISQVVGITLLHSLWQGLLLYTLLRIFIASAPGITSSAKYGAGLFALTASVVWPVITFFIELSKHPLVQPFAGNGTDGLPYLPVHHAASALSVSSTAPGFSIDPYLPYLVAFWLIGISINSIRLLWGWRNLTNIKQSFIDTPALQKRAMELAKLIDLSKKVRVFMSQNVDVPCIIGYLKPTIILPVAVVTQFSAEQIETILLHEMAHVRRNDYLVNILQQIAGVLFFFNPFTQLINRIIYNEREHCCDDLVLQTTGKPLVYAHALLQLEQMRQTGLHLALAATGKKYYLLNRIKRMMETKKQVNNFRHILVAILLLTGSMGTIAWLNPEIKNGKIVVNPVELPGILTAHADTVKKAPKTKKTVTTAPKKSTTAKQVYSKGTINIDYRSEDDPKLKKLEADIEKRSQAMDKLYHSGQMAEIEKQFQEKSRAIDSLYKRPEMKRMQDTLDERSRAFEKMNDSPEMKELQKRMEALGKIMEKYYNSDEVKKMQKLVELQSKLVSEEEGTKNSSLDKDREELKKLSEQMRDYNNNPEIKKNQQEMRELGKQMSAFYQSEAYKSQRDAINRASAEVRKMYQDPAIKQQTEEIRKLSSRMRDYQKSPEMLKAKEDLKKAELALNNYRNSAEFKKHQDKIRVQIKNLMKDMQYKADTTSSGK